jgi:acetyltransferase-like isoleucine patch superfamily enzyme
MRKISIPRNWSDITIESGVALDDNVVLLCGGAAKRDKLVIHSRTYVNRSTVLDAIDRIEVGANCMIGPHCYITDANHGMALGERIADQPMTSSPVLIEDGAWLGAGVIVLKGVRIGAGAIIGAGAVVINSIGAHEKVAGVPARLIGYRS